MKFHNDHHANDYIFVPFGFYVNVFNSTETYYSEIFSHLLNFFQFCRRKCSFGKTFYSKDEQKGFIKSRPCAN